MTQAAPKHVAPKPITGFALLDEQLHEVLTHLKTNPREALAHYPSPGQQLGPLVTMYNGPLWRHGQSAEALQQHDRVEQLLADAYTTAALKNAGNAAVACKALATYHHAQHEGYNRDFAHYLMLEIADRYPAVVMAANEAQADAVPKDVARAASAAFAKAQPPANLVQAASGEGKLAAMVAKRRECA
jgi:hypothetical protein